MNLALFNNNFRTKISQLYVTYLSLLKVLLLKRNLSLNLSTIQLLKYFFSFSFYMFKLTDKYISDIDPLLNKVCDATTQNPKLTTPRIEVDKSLFAVELKNLNPQNEMRRTFGKRVVKVE